MHRSLLAGAAIGTLIAALAATWLWRDEPAPPTPRAAVSCTPAGGDLDAALRITALDAELPTALQQALDRGTALARMQWSTWLADDRLTGGPVDLVFIADAQRFARLYDGPDVDGWTTTGFYRIRTHEAVILWAEPWRSQALATALHEVSHLLTAWHLGPTPPWLNEGLAEHFETVDGEGRGFRRSAAHLQTLRRHGPVDLDTLLSLTRRAFAAEEAERRYASAWALVAFLLDGEPGRTTFEELLRDAHARQCEPGMAFTPLLARYPGGLSALQEDWRRWLGDRAAAASLP